MAPLKTGKTEYSAGQPEKNDDFRELPEEKIQLKRGPIDMPFFLLVLVILTIGVITVLSASFANAYYAGNAPTYFFLRQSLFAAVGVIGMLVISRFPVSLFRKYSLHFYIVTMVMLALVLVPGIGKEINGARRWLGFGELFTIQPSEIAKLAIILIFANMSCAFRDKLKTFRWGILPFLLVLGATAAMVILERHISATSIILLVGAVMMFVGGSNLAWLLSLGAVGVAGIVFIIQRFGYSMDRVNAWRDPWSDRLNTGFQIIQSLYAIGSGGLLGVGIGQSRQKYLYLPYDYNDYIFSIYCEEMGFIGALLLLTLFALLILRGYWLAMHCRDRFGSLVITGITTLLAVQVILNVAVVTNSMPSTGISLPFFSYGGTALLLQLGEMGIILSISRDIPLRRTEKTELPKKKEKAGENKI